MKYIELSQKIKEPVFSLNDLRIEGLKVFPYQLTRWVKNGYLIKLKNGFYAFSERKDKLLNEHIAFLLYQPSYLSLEWALSKYNLIPEIVYSLTSVTTRSPRIFKNELGSFIYRSIKKELFWGYRKIKENNQIYLLAEPEKALCDFLYFNSDKIKDRDDFNSFRFNEKELQKLDQEKIKKFCKIINNNSLSKIIKKCLI